MSDLPWVRFFPSDWLAGTRGMSAAETGIYITLIATMYERGEPIPEDTKRLARLCGASNSAFKQALEILIDEGKIDRVEGGLWNRKVEKECKNRSEKSEMARNAGIKSGRVRQERNADLRKRRLADAKKVGTHTPQEWTALLAACGGKCVKCDSADSIEKDHIKPIYQGGSDGIENLQPLCRSCNAGKGPDNTDYRPDNWEGRFAEIISVLGGNIEEIQSQNTTSVQPERNGRSTNHNHNHNHSLKEEKNTKKENPDLIAFKSHFSTIDEGQLNDFIKLRRSKRAMMTDRSGQLFLKDCEQCGMSVSEAIDMCISRNWITVKPEYFNGKQFAKPQSQDRSGVIGIAMEMVENEQKANFGGNVELLSSRRKD